MSKYFDLMYESTMVPTPVPYAPNVENSEMPNIIFVAFDKEKTPIFSPRGIIITAMSSQSLIEKYALSLYKLLRNADEVYSIIPELYTEAVTRLSQEEYYDYISKNAKLHKQLEDITEEEVVYDNILDTDPDFKIETTLDNEVFKED